MKAFMKTETCTLSTLTPIHIGSGEDYYPTNYVIDDGYLHYFGEMQMLQALSEPDLNQLARIAEEKHGQAALQQIQAFVHERRQTLKQYSAHVLPASDGVERLYQDRIGQTAQRETGGRNISNQLAIQRSSFNPHSQIPYLPGSSVKGAIRTALLDTLNDGRRLKRVTDPKTHQERPQNNLELQQDLLRFSARNLEDDPLRLLKVGDAEYRHGDGLNGLEIRFAVNRKRKPSDKPTRADNGPPILLECLAAARSQAFQMALTLQNGDPLKELSAKLPFSDFPGLAASCNRFYLKQRESELKRLPGLGYVPRGCAESLSSLLKGEWGRRCGK
jgi:CRISPR-associated protein Csm5